MAPRNDSPTAGPGLPRAPRRPVPRGRCGAGHAVVGTDMIPVGTELAARLQAPDGQTLDVTLSLHADAVSGLYAALGDPDGPYHGWSWDGTVVLPSGATSYTDPSLVRGGYPEDCPVHLRQRIGAAVRRGNRHLAPIRDQGRQVARAVALELRHRGYPRLSDQELDRLVARHPCGSLAESGLHRLLTSADRDVLLASLTDGSAAVSAETLARLADQLDDTAVVGVFDRHHQLVRAWLGDTRVVADQGWNPKVPPGLRRGLVAPRARRWREQGVPMCFTCQAPAGRCGCPRDVEALTRLLAGRHGAEVRDDHSWGHEHAVRPTSDMEAQAEGLSHQVRDHLRAADPLGELDLCSGDLGYDVALFCAQCGLGPDETLELVQSAGPYLTDLLTRTRSRADSIHSGYTRAIYAEFYGPDATAADDTARVYLGRDGIYPYLADLELRAALDRRGDPRATTGSSTYVSVSRKTRWTSRHNRLLSGDGTILIDTGFTGSVPALIASGAGHKMSPGVIVDPGPGQAAMRLLHAHDSRRGFVWQIGSLADAETVEWDAKDARSSRFVNDRAPTGALEQLVFRQLSSRIRANAASQADEILDLPQRGTTDELTDARFDAAPTTTDPMGWRGPPTRPRVVTPEEPSAPTGPPVTPEETSALTQASTTFLFKVWASLDVTEA